MLHDPGAGALGGGPEGQALQQRVHRRRHAVQPAHEHDLAVEELRLDRARPAGQALPAGAPLPLPRRRGRHLQEVAPPLPVLLGARHVDPRRGQRLLALALRLTRQRAEPALGPGQGLDRVGQVHEELAVLPAHDVRAGHRLEGRRRDGVGDGLAPVVQAGGEAPEVEHPRDGGRVHLDDAGPQLGGGAHDAHAVGVREVAQHPALVLHPVLHADHRRGRRRHARAARARGRCAGPSRPAARPGPRRRRPPTTPAPAPSTTGMGSVTVPSGASRTRPDRRARPWSPRATSVTS